jgi:hypothetical protein
MSTGQVTWVPRTREDRMLRSHLQQERRAGEFGMVHVEVPFGRPSGGASRRLDAVRFLGGKSRIVRFRQDLFEASLAAAAEIVLIEVKPKLNRPVIGQLIAAEILVREEWGLSPSSHLRMVAVVAEVDPALMLVCDRLGIRVATVRHPRPAA